MYLDNYLSLHKAINCNIKFLFRKKCSFYVIEINVNMQTEESVNCEGSQLTKMYSQAHFAYLQTVVYIAISMVLVILKFNLTNF
jgi:hypothetical protein